MAPRGRDVEEALLAWVNGFTKGRPSKARTLADLTDGAIFLKVLERFDRAYADDITLEPVTPSSKWLAKKKNLENVHKSLVRYIGHHCNIPPIALKEPVDFNAVAENTDVEQTMKVAENNSINLEVALTNIAHQLLSIFLMAAVSSNVHAQEFITEIQSLPESIAAPLAEIIQAMNSEEDQNELKNTDDAGLPPVLSKNLDLEIEEEFAKLTKQHETLVKKYADERTNNERLQLNNEELIFDIHKKDRELKLFRGVNNEADTNQIANLRLKVSEREAVIYTLEQQIEEDRDLKEKHAKELVVLRPLQIQVQELLDEKSELQAINQSLVKRANKVDHYEKKLISQATHLKEFERVRATNATLESNMASFDKVHAHNLRLTEEIEAYRAKMQAYEMDIHEALMRRDLFDSELKTKDAQIAKLLERQAHDEQFIQTLQENSLGNDSQRSPDSPLAGPKHLNLETELEESETLQVNHSLEISRLQAENQLLRANTAGTTNPNLRVDKEQLQAIVKRLQTTNQELMEKHAIGQEQLNALLNEQSGEMLVKIAERLMKFGPLQYLTEGFYRNESISNTRKLWLDATKDLGTTKAELAELHMKLTESGRQLLAATAELNALDKEEVDALEELRSANETITASLRNDLLVLQGEHNSLRTDYDLQKTQLNAALLAKDKALSDLANLRDMGNLNDHILSEKAQAEKRLQDEKSRSSLNEVSRRSVGAQKAPASNRKSIWGAFTKATKPIRNSFIQLPSQLPQLSQLSPVHKHKPVRPRPVTINLTAQQAHDEELMRELAAIGAAPMSPVSPRNIPLPASPLDLPPPSKIRQRRGSLNNKH